MTPHHSLQITTRDGKTMPCHVVEVGFQTFLNSIQFKWVETQLAEAAIRLQSAAGVFDQRVPPGWLDTLDDDSTTAVVRASTELNIHPERVKKALALIREGVARMEPKEIPSETSSASPSS